MPRIILAAFLLLAVSASNAASQNAPQNDPMAGYYGNTFICRGDTWECRVWFYPDRTFISFGMNWADGAAKLSGSEGTWTIENGKLCRFTKGSTTQRPCAQQLDFGEPNKKVGDTWDAIAGNGRPEKLSVIAGHH